MFRKEDDEYLGPFLTFMAPCHVILHTPVMPSKNWDMWQYVSCTPVAPNKMRMVYRAYRNWLAKPDFIFGNSLVKNFMDKFSTKIIFQDYELLAAQAQRLGERALPWNSSIQADCLPLLYRRFWRKTFGLGFEGGRSETKLSGQHTRTDPKSSSEDSEAKP